MIVVDASLAIKWLLDESDSGSATAFLARYEAELCAPDLLAIEVSRALVTAVNTRRIERDAGQVLLASWLRSIDERRPMLHPTVPLLGRASTLALDLGHPLPDCIYLALALELDCTLATSDARFAADARRVYSAVRMLRDYDIAAP